MVVWTPRPCAVIAGVPGPIPSSLMVPVHVTSVWNRASAAICDPTSMGLGTRATSSVVLIACDRTGSVGSARMERLDGAVAVITGAGSGIGRGTALALAAAGTHVVVTDINDQRASDV